MIHTPISRETSQQEGDRLLDEDRAVRRASPLYAEIQRLRQEHTDPDLPGEARKRVEARAANLRDEAGAIAADAGLSENELEKLCAADLRAKGRQQPRAPFNPPRVGKSIMAASRSLKLVEDAIARDQREEAAFRDEVAKINGLIDGGAGAQTAQRLGTRRMSLLRDISSSIKRRVRKEQERDRLLLIVNGEAA